ncbi:peptidoglycan-binding protein LysM [Tenacibaculum sp. 190524A02b]|uniref:Peptidoglycan-binding protein LysM n=1 Tax=Tenacibaculum vairaonense TaxID=3137860 RepID=A0ABM9PLC3_9FLAO
MLTSFTLSPAKKEITTTLPIIKVDDIKEFNFPFLQKDFIGFKEALGFKESQGKYTVINKLGYLGKYQFGKSTLKRFKIYNTQRFLKNPELQERTFIALCKVNKWILRKDIRRSVGKKIKGILITESGILAAAHLSGAGNVKKFLRTNGKFQFKDAFGTTIEEYLKKFSGYNVSDIPPNKSPLV